MMLLSKFTRRIPWIVTSRTSSSGAPQVGKDPLDLTFSDTIASFKSKRTTELIRGLVIFNITSINWVVENNNWLMKMGRKVMGKWLFELVMKATFYGQFVAGEDTERIMPTVRRLHSFGVRAILDYSVEEDLDTEEAKNKEVEALSSKGSGKEEPGKLVQYKVDRKFADRRYKVTGARTYFYTSEKACENNLNNFLKSIEATHQTTKSTGGPGLMAIKLTSLGRPQLLLTLSEVIMTARNYMAELSGSSASNVVTHKKTMEDLKRYYGDLAKDSPELKAFLDHITADNKGVIHLFPWSDVVDHDMDLSATFRLPDPKTGQMRRLVTQIPNEEEALFRNMLLRLGTVLKAGQELNVNVMIDAEQTYFQPAISRITMEMMKKFNKDKFTVWNTYQTYLKSTYSEIVADLELAQRQNFNWAAKLVRGAYMEQERARAKEMNYPDPICDNFEATTASYHKCLKEVLMRYNSDMKGNIMAMAASHNEDTVRYAITEMKELNISPASRVICFGQLLGMSDNLTFPLGQSGYSSYKYVPYGPVLEVLPYLSRRANENRGFLAKVKKEKKMLFSEIIRRTRSGQFFYEPVGNYKPV